MAEKKRKGRRAYLNDFQKDEKGQYVYQGALYEWKGEKGTLRRELMVLWGLCIVMMASLLTAGCVDTPGAMNAAYVVLPLTVSLVFGISAGWGLWRLTSGGNPMRAYVYEQSAGRIPGRLAGTMLGAGMTVAGEMIFLFRNGFGEKVPETVLFVGLEGLAFAMAAIFRIRIGKMNWENVKNENIN